MAFLEISTGIRCPMDCSYCPRESIAGAYDGPAMMSLEVFTRALAHCPPGLRVSFAGFAEPYLNRRCTEMVRHAVATGHPVQMYTTGVGMDDEDVVALIDAQPSPAVIHLPDADGDMLAKVTPAYVARVTRLAERVPGCKAVCYGRWHAGLEHLKPMDAGYGLHSRAGNVAHKTQVRRRGPLRCRPAPMLDESVMLPDGRLVLCCNDWGLRHVVGDLTRETWDEIHAGPAMTEMRRVMKAGEACLCQSCEFAERA